MSEIELKRANVVKRVDSEDKAKALEAKGFVRTDGTVANKTESNAASEAVINELKEQYESIRPCAALQFYHKLPSGTGADE